MPSPKRVLPPPPAEERLVDADPSPLPFGMRPAPPRKVAAPIPVDLGAYDAELAGWCVVIDTDAPFLLMGELAETMQDNEASESDRLAALKRFVETICVAWNFTRVIGSGSELVPQPRAGGSIHITRATLNAISRAYRDAVKVPNA